jgi:hypothetical protein
LEKKVENTITDYDLDDYFSELSTKYKSREVQISRYLKNKKLDGKLSDISMYLKKEAIGDAFVVIALILLFKIIMRLMKDWLVTFMLI